MSKMIPKQIVNSKQGIQLIMVDDEPRIDSRLIAPGLGVKHKTVMETIRKHQKRFERFGHLPFETALGKRVQGGGKSETFVLLNESQSIFLMTLSRNTEQVMDLKENLITLFDKYRRQLLKLASGKARQAKLEWQQKRGEVKVVRREETDTIKDFIEYAKKQGSKNAGKYYIAISRMENQALFFLDAALPKLNDFRDQLDLRQLTHLSSAEYVIMTALREGIEKEMPYKAIFQMAKQIVVALGVIVGKSEVPHVLENHSANKLSLVEKNVAA